MRLPSCSITRGSLRLTKDEQTGVREWAGRMLWIAALSGGVFGLLGGWLIDRLGRKTHHDRQHPGVLAFSGRRGLQHRLWQLVLFRCTTFIGVCVEMVAAVTWLAELFEDKRTREIVIGWTLATASLGGILVTRSVQPDRRGRQNTWLTAWRFPFPRDIWRTTSPGVSRC